MSNAQQSETDVIEYGAHPELAVAALIEMMGSFAAVPRPAVALSILAHLHIVATDTRLPPSVRAAAGRAHRLWRKRMHGAPPREIALDS
jgi:hypothetical protein